MPRLYVRTSTGWVDLSVQGPVGPTGPTGPQGPAGAGLTDVEGTGDFAALGTDYTIPNASWGTPGWFTPIIVGPNQMWMVLAECAYRCVTTAHPLYHAVTFRDTSGVALGAGYTKRETATLGQPANTTNNFTDICVARLITDGTIAPGTTVRVQQQFNGIGANGRVLRDGTYYNIHAWRTA